MGKQAFLLKQTDLFNFFFNFPQYFNKLRYSNPQPKEISWQALLKATFFDSAFKFTW